MIYEWLYFNWKWSLSILLSILVLYYAYRTYRKQVETTKKAEIVEELKGIGDINLSSNLKVRPTLRQYRNPILSEKYVEIELKFYTALGPQIAGVSPPAWYPVKPSWRYPEKIDIDKIVHIKSTFVNEYGIVIKCSLTDPVKYKEITEKTILMMLQTLREKGNWVL